MPDVNVCGTPENFAREMTRAAETRGREIERSGSRPCKSNDVIERRHRQGERHDQHQWDHGNLGDTDEIGNRIKRQTLVEGCDRGMPIRCQHQGVAIGCGFRDAGDAGNARTIFHDHTFDSTPAQACPQVRAPKCQQCFRP